MKFSIEVSVLRRMLKVVKQKRRGFRGFDPSVRLSACGITAIHGSSSNCGLLLGFSKAFEAARAEFFFLQYFTTASDAFKSQGVSERSV